MLGVYWTAGTGGLRDGGGRVSRRVILCRTSAVWQFGILASSPKFGDFAKNPNHDFALVPEHGRVRLVDVVLGNTVFLNPFGVSVRDLLNFGRGLSQNPLVDRVTCGLF